MTLFCKYSNIFGEPKKGRHSYRIGPFAIYDMSLTIIVGWGLGYYFISQDIKGGLIGFLLLLLLGVIAHTLFCVDTVIKF